MTVRSDETNTTSAKIGLSKAGSRTILSPKESLTHQNLNELETVFNACIKQHGSEVILDCKSVNFLDSEVLELRVKMQGELKKRGGVELNSTDIKLG